MCKSTHDTSLLFPSINIDRSSPNCPCRRLLQSVLAPVTDVPVMSHDTETPFTQVLRQMDRTHTRRVRSSLSPSFATGKADSAKEFFRRRRTTAETVDLVIVFPVRKVMMGYKDLEREGFVHCNNNTLLLAEDVVAADNPLEVSSPPGPLVVVCDLGPCQGTPVPDNEIAPFVVELETEMAVGNAVQGQNNIAIV